MISVSAMILACSELLRRLTIQVIEHVNLQSIYNRHDDLCKNNDGGQHIEPVIRSIMYDDTGYEL